MVSDLREFFTTQPKTYGYPIISFPSFSGESVFVVTIGRVKKERRLLALFNAIKRETGYEPLLGQKPEEYLKYGYGRLVDDGNDLIEVIISDKRHKGYYSISYCEI